MRSSRHMPIIPADSLSQPVAATPAPSGPEMLGLYPSEIAALLNQLGEPSYRANQVFHWLHRRGVESWEAMSDLPVVLRNCLAERWCISRSTNVQQLQSSDGLTSKVLVRLWDGQDIETVIMDTRPTGEPGGRKTICVSTQAGCAMGCVFCVTGQFGFARNLTAAEIVEQVLRSSHAGRPVTNVVFMGMGEPLANYDQTIRALRLLTHPEGLGLGARRITISTSGLVPQIKRLAGERLQVGLAISLHAANDELRSRLMPINRRWPLADLLSAAESYFRETGRRVTYEYTLMADVNDSDPQADELAALLAGSGSHVNLIPLNPTEDPDLRAPGTARALSFERRLLAAGIGATIRTNRGRDIRAACGQLRLSERRRPAAVTS